MEVVIWAVAIVAGIGVISWATLRASLEAWRSRERIELAKLSADQAQAEFDRRIKDLAKWTEGVDHQLQRLQNQVDMLKAQKGPVRTITGLKG